MMGVPQLASDLSIEKVGVSSMESLKCTCRSWSTYKDLLARHARLLPAISDLILILVACCSINVTVTTAQSVLNCLLDLVGLGKLLRMRELVPKLLDTWKQRTQVPRPTAGIS